MSDTTPTISIVGKQELIVGRILRLGVILSFTLVVIGMAVTFSSTADHPTHDTLDLIHSHATPAGAAAAADARHFPHSLTDIFRDSLALRGPALVMLGIVVLVSTPVIRVAASVVLFALQRDRFYVATTSLVLVLLIISLFLGRGA